MADTVIRVENLSKKYVIGHQTAGSYSTLRDKITDGAKAIGQRLIHGKKVRDTSQEEFWALNDVSFEVKQGDRLGIIGRNGAGKSTLLKILSRITEPTSGQITIHGRVASLLEVGTGFHAELTGRENIFLNGAILGMSRAEIRQKFDEIVDFAEIEKFLDTPVKRYSSGMYVRLAFAVAAHLEPEILIVDEVLAVGDIQFQKKCLGKMQEVSENQGRTVLFVSHNIDTVQRLCSWGFILEKGQINFCGNTSEIIPKYLSNNTQTTSPNTWINVRKGAGYETQNTYFLEASYSSLNKKQLFYPYSGGPIDFLLKIWADSSISVYSIAIFITTLTGTMLVNADTAAIGQVTHLKRGINLIKLSVYKLHLKPGKYNVGLWLDKTGSGDEALDYIESAFEVEITSFASRLIGIETIGPVDCQFSCQLIETEHSVD